MLNWDKETLRLTALKFCVGRLEGFKTEVTIFLGGLVIVLNPFPSPSQAPDHLLSLFGNCASCSSHQIIADDFPLFRFVWACLSAFEIFAKMTGIKPYMSRNFDRLLRLIALRISGAASRKDHGREPCQFLLTWKFGFVHGVVVLGRIFKS